MSKTTAQVRFTLVDDGLEVSVPRALAPLDEFFETEVGASDATLDMIEHHVRHDRTWQLTGDACQLDLDGETVTVRHNYTGTHTTLTRADFRSLLTDLRVLLTG